MDALKPSWAATLTKNLERQLMRVQIQAVDRIKKANGCQMAQEYAARTAVNALFNNNSEQMAAWKGAREGLKIVEIIKTLNLIHSDSKKNQQKPFNSYENHKKHN